ncbi:AraC family transcriptional regulator [Cohnella zeiphila]|uniref:AraC family transcriptional regulator n=1 Tax=Cohnella zeiphila TaxID=2761120 RepID=A0A7X0SJU5_9BACL|nr:helix-turn-helix domain-containing protein [Cohnella zeiphila]MBB6731297.1 AraC family transcriptional regulator [Cohnella zeiphila]
MTGDGRAFGTFGFRFAAADELPLCELFAVGHERETQTAYDWDGLARTDGPLLLFQYTIEGCGELAVEERLHRLMPGQAFLVEIPGRHRYRLPEDSPAWEFIYILLRPRMALSLWTGVKDRIGEAPFLPQGSGPIRALRDLIWDAGSGRIADPFSASSHTYRFLMELTRFARAKGLSDSLWPPAVKEAVHYMDRHYGRMIGQEQLASDLGLSRYHFLRMFSRYVGMTPGEYVSKVRVEKSIELLRHTDWSLERIAAAVGYSSGSYFIKVFRRLTGQTPAVFRSGKQLPYTRFFFD